MRPSIGLAVTLEFHPCASKHSDGVQHVSALNYEAFDFVTAPGDEYMSPAGEFPGNELYGSELPR